MRYRSEKRVLNTRKKTRGRFEQAGMKERKRERRKEREGNGKRRKEKRRRENKRDMGRMILTPRDDQTRFHWFIAGSEQLYQQQATSLFFLSHSLSLFHITIFSLTFLHHPSLCSYEQILCHPHLPLSPLFRSFSLNFSTASSKKTLSYPSCHALVASPGLPLSSPPSLFFLFHSFFFPPLYPSFSPFFSFFLLLPKSVPLVSLFLANKIKEYLMD